MESGFTISQAQVQEWATEIKAIDAEIARLQEKREALDRRLEAVALLFDQARPLTGAPKTLREFVLDVLASAQSGILPGELFDLATDSDIRERMERNRNAIYTVIGRLAERGEIVRHGKLLYSPSLYNRVSAGKVHDPRFESGGEEISVPDLILGVLNDAGMSMTAGAIIDKLRMDEAVAEKLQRNPQYVYTVLGRMVSRKQLERRGQRYAVPGSELSNEELIG